MDKNGSARGPHAPGGPGRDRQGQGQGRGRFTCRRYEGAAYEQAGKEVEREDWCAVDPEEIFKFQAAPGPEYNSLGRMRAQRTVPEKLAHLAVSIACTGTVGLVLSLCVVIAAEGLAKIVIAAMYWKSCETSPFLPRYLLSSGLAPVVFYVTCRTRKWRGSPPSRQKLAARWQYSVLHYTFDAQWAWQAGLAALLSLFMLGWLVYGTVLTVETMQEMRDRPVFCTIAVNATATHHWHDNSSLTGHAPSLAQSQQLQRDVAVSSLQTSTSGSGPRRVGSNSSSEYFLVKDDDSKSSASGGQEENSPLKSSSDDEAGPTKGFAANVRTTTRSTNGRSRRTTASGGERFRALRGSTPSLNKGNNMSLPSTASYQISANATTSVTTNVSPYISPSPSLTTPAPPSSMTKPSKSTSSTSLNHIIVVLIPLENATSETKPYGYTGLPLPRTHFRAVEDSSPEATTKFPVEGSEAQAEVTSLCRKCDSSFVTLCLYLVLFDWAYVVALLLNLLVVSTVPCCCDLEDPAKDQCVV